MILYDYTHYQLSWATPGQPWQRLTVLVPIRRQGESSKDYHTRTADYVGHAYHLPANAILVLK